MVVQDGEVCSVMKRRLQVRSRAGPASIEVEKAVPFAAAAVFFRYGDGGKKRRREPRAREKRCYAAHKDGSWAQSQRREGSGRARFGRGCRFRGASDTIERHLSENLVSGTGTGAGIKKEECSSSSSSSTEVQRGRVEREVEREVESLAGSVGDGIGWNVAECRVQRREVWTADH